MSKQAADDELYGLVREAMAYRVKYRSKDLKKAKRRLALCLLCVHKRNRGGQYPMAETVQNLGISIFEDGFNPEEANHAGVCVQEIPHKHQPPEYQTSLQFNVKSCQGTLLEGCFPDDGGDARYGTLSRSHLLLTLLSWLAGL